MVKIRCFDIPPLSVHFPLFLAKPLISLSFLPNPSFPSLSRQTPHFPLFFAKPLISLSFLPNPSFPSLPCQTPHFPLFLAKPLISLLFLPNPSFPSLSCQTPHYFISWTSFVDGPKLDSTNINKIRQTGTESFYFQWPAVSQQHASFTLNWDNNLANLNRTNYYTPSTKSCFYICLSVTPGSLAAGWAPFSDPAAWTSENNS